jgi:ribosomal protein S24E
MGIDIQLLQVEVLQSMVECRVVDDDRVVVGEGKKGTGRERSSGHTRGR